MQNVSLHLEPHCEKQKKSSCPSFFFFLNWRVQRRLGPTFGTPACWRVGTSGLMGSPKEARDCQLAVSEPYKAKIISTRMCLCMFV